MTKKDFTADAAGVFVSKMITPTPVQPKQTAKKQQPKAAKKAAAVPQQPKEEVKETFFLDKQLDDRLRYYVFTQRTTLKAVLTESLRNYLDKHAPQK